MKRKLAFIWLLSLLLALIGLFALKTGSYSLTSIEIFQAFVGVENGTVKHILWNIRLPRILAAIFSGAGLAMSGAVMQSILRNPLASPFTLGISHGAVFGVAVAVVFLGTDTTHRAGTDTMTMPSYLVVSCAFLGALLSILFVLAVSSIRQVGVEGLILAGVAIGAFFGAATMLIQYFSTELQVSAMIFWTFGDLGRASWQEVIAISTTVIGMFLYFYSNNWDYNAIRWGDETAISLGVNVRLIRIGGMLLSGVLVALITAFLGIIGFIGLIAPHIMRFFIGDDYRFLLPCSAIFGGLFLLVSDIAARSIIPSVDVPVGIITSFSGAPVFIYLLIKKRWVRG